MNQLHRWFCRSAGWKRALRTTILPWALAGIDLGEAVLEVGPGPSQTTDVLRQQVAHRTALEVDHRLAETLRQRVSGTNVEIVEGDATAMPFADATFSGVVAFTMLHHVPSRELQDRLLAEVYRVLQPGGVFVGTDSRWSHGLQLVHLGDTLVSVDPDTLGPRLVAAGFVEVSVELARRTFRFRAKRLETTSMLPTAACWHEWERRAHTFWL